MNETQSVHCYTCSTGHNLGVDETLARYEACKAKGHIVELVRRTYREVDYAK